jgi:hypothetical protein
MDYLLISLSKSQQYLQHYNSHALHYSIDLIQIELGSNHWPSADSIGGPFCQ